MYFALIVFAVMAMASLVIDMGFVRLTQVQMQPGVEAAALEGLRFRDQLPDAWLQDGSDFLTAVQSDCGPRPALPQSLTDPAWVAWRDNVRRWLARYQLSLVYANRLDPSNDDPSQPSFGAGPIYAFSGGVGNSNALQTVTNPTAPLPYVYQPALQLNLVSSGTGNAQNGDMVAGTYITPPNTNPAYPGDDPRDENSTYTRRDFTAASSASASTAPSFLVRLRRLNDFQAQNALENQSGVSSHGPQMPLLFGRGSTLTGVDPSTGYAPRYHGLTTRATAIADAQPAFSIGTAYPSSIPVLPGAAPFIIFNSGWNNANLFPTDTSTMITVNNDGTLNAAGTTIGYFTSSSAGQLTSVGQPTTALRVAPSAGQMSASLTDPAYVPIILAPNSGTPIDGTIIGFGFLTVDLTSVTATGFQVTKRIGKVAPANATSVPVQQLPRLFSGSGNVANVQLLFSLWDGLRSSSLLTPALAH
jgi:hypothetical protein